MNINQVLILTNHNLTAAYLLHYLCIRHDECVRYMPKDARASIVRPYSIKSFIEALEEVPSIEQVHQAIDILKQKKFIDFYQHVDPAQKWYEVLMPNLGMAILMIKSMDCLPDEEQQIFTSWSEIQTAIEDKVPLYLR
jgi:hypothetical protein